MAVRSFTLSELDATVLRQIVQDWLDEGLEAATSPLTLRAEWLAWRLLPDSKRFMQMPPMTGPDEGVAAAVQRRS